MFALHVVRLKKVFAELFSKSDRGYGASSSVTRHLFLGTFSGRGSPKRAESSFGGSRGASYGKEKVDN